MGLILDLGDTYELVVWSGAEDFVIIVCGSIPALKLFWNHHIKRQRTLAGTRFSGYQSQKERGPISSPRYKLQTSSVLSQNRPLVSTTCENKRPNILVTSDIEILSRGSSMM